ncbi:rhomboid family intramembrane serine protease [candidate division KSB1 bacterium]|nr:rhomboid family intramembrane serine protease [candidate division KSB1 bacterium]NIR69320.1 rhomboid family intramembrane serine protease [candidate division KSB1 bacterium]NIS22726.1 rhomboid family intramembrane serine protease [candidate division KSB1 bacterium]NIT69572.1 rhomboid family intramembrane serine protease [candidate division KSB1 bacterium]NIU23226.1 rhomboid family intramembrane serine protease [candidate division KSB1 bacterium]
MLSILFDHKKAGRPLITIVFAASCLIVSLPTLFFPGLYEVFGGYKPLSYPWQKLTLAFEHGFSGYPLIVHLGFNGFLLWYCGILAEKILGSARFLLLTLAAMVGFALAHSLAMIEGHGSSGVIWAYSPIVFVTLHSYQKMNKDKASSDPKFNQGKTILIIMWGVVTVFMAIIPYLFGWRGNIFFALIFGNIFHISGTCVGFLLILFWRNHIHRRLENLESGESRKHFDCTSWDKLAVALSMLIPVSLLTIEVLFLTGQLTRH